MTNNSQKLLENSLEKLCIMDGFHLSKRAILKNNYQCSILKLKTRDAFPAAKTRKEGFRKVFNVWSKSTLATLGWDDGRSPGHKNVCRWFTKFSKLVRSIVFRCFRPSQQNCWLLRVQHTLYVIENDKKNLCKRNLNLQNP